MAVRAVRHRSRAATKTALVQAASRPPDLLTTHEAELNGDAIETFAQAIGGREQLAAVLAVAGGQPEVEKVIDALSDSRTAQLSLRRLCLMSGITVADLFVAYKKALFTQAHLQAAAIIAGQIPPLVSDVMTRAVPQDLLCPACGGQGGLPAAPPCLKCLGTGKVKSEPDLDRQKVALELGHLLERKGIVMQQQTNVAAAALTSHGVGALESLQHAVGELLFSPGRRRRQSPREDPLPEPLPTEIDVPLPFKDQDPEPFADAPDDDPSNDPEHDPPPKVS